MFDRILQVSYVCRSGYDDVFEEGNSEFRFRFCILFVIHTLTLCTMKALIYNITWKNKMSYYNESKETNRNNNQFPVKTSSSVLNSPPNWVVRSWTTNLHKTFSKVSNATTFVRMPPSWSFDFTKGRLIILCTNFSFLKCRSISTCFVRSYWTGYSEILIMEKLS